jgi:hypothetical protein
LNSWKEKSGERKVRSGKINIWLTSFYVTPFAFSNFESFPQMKS